jgi:hypothetical protein
MPGDRPVFTHIEVEANESFPSSANMVFKNLTDPVFVSRVRIFDGAPEGTMHVVTGWSSAGGGTPVPAFAAQVEDSGAGAAFIVYGGDWGIRLRPESSASEWSLTDPDQWGETHLLLADAEDLVLMETR